MHARRWTDRQACFLAHDGDIDNVFQINDDDQKVSQALGWVIMQL
jgi:hypothetical protein